MPRAEASHILVKTEQQAADLKSQIESGQATFADLAKKHSSCPSGKSGGSLGLFSKGDMVPEFDRVVFSDMPLGTVSAPVKTQFGWHILTVAKRMA
jgi:peptidyl-prolyl cis-trans isomerase C